MLLRTRRSDLLLFARAPRPVLAALVLVIGLGLALGAEARPTASLSSTPSLQPTTTPTPVPKKVKKVKVKKLKKQKKQPPQPQGKKTKSKSKKAKKAKAKQITKAGDCVKGPLSRCRVGDYLLENGEIRVVVQDLQRNMFGIGQYGGQIIDADLKRKGGDPEIDNFEEWSVSLNIENTAHYTDITIVNDGGHGQPAVIRVSGPDDLLDRVNASSTIASFGFPFPASADDTDLPVEVTTDYILEPGVNYVRVETRVQNTDPGTPLDIFFGEYLGGSGQLELFQPGYGFGETLVSTRCPAGVANPCNALIYRGIDGAAGVSYGYLNEMLDSTAFTTDGVSVPQLGVEITLALIGAAAPNFNIAPMGMPGDQLLFTRYFVVGDGTVSSILDARYDILGIATGTLRGTIETATGGPVAGAEVTVLASPADGPNLFGAFLNYNVISSTVTDEWGHYSLTLAPGSYDIAVNLEGHPYQGGGALPALNPVVIVPATVIDLDATVPDTGQLRVLVADGGGASQPAKASVVGFDPSTDPANTQSILGLINNSTSLFRDRMEDGLAFGLTQVLFIEPNGTSPTIPIEPGSYEVVVSRGPEYSIDSIPVGVATNALSTASAKLGRIIDTSGFVSGDFHVHSIDSADSSVTRLDRVVSMLAEGLEFFTPSDHGFRSDFQPLVLSRGWGDLVTTATSGEITTFDYGHFNAWPMTIDPTKVNGGSVDHGGAAPAGEDFPSFGNYSLTPGEIMAVADSDPGSDTIQINHMYSHFGLDGGSGLAIDTGLVPPMSAVPPAARRLDPALEDPAVGYFSDAFDVLEVWIGDSRGQIFDNFLGQNAGDWFNLLNQGVIRTGIADSDTHRRILTQAGVPRTMIASAVDAPALLDAETLSAAVNAGKAFGTNGPMLRVSLEALTGATTASLENGAASLVSATDGKVEVTVGVQSPAWAEFDTVEFYVNTTTVQSIIADQATGAGDVDVVRYGVTPLYTLVKDVDFSVSTVLADATVPGGDRLEATATLTLDGVSNPALTEDSWIVVMVRGTDGVSRPLFPMVPNNLATGPNTTVGDLTDGNLGESGITTLSFTNPLFVDVDGNGVFDAPGVSFIPAAP